MSARGRRIALYQSDLQQPLCFAPANVTSVVSWVLGLSHHRLLHKAATTANQLTNTHTHTNARARCFMFLVYCSHFTTGRKNRTIGLQMIFFYYYWKKKKKRKTSLGHLLAFVLLDLQKLLLILILFHWCIIQVQLTVVAAWNSAGLAYPLLLSLQQNYAPQVHKWTRPKSEIQKTCAIIFHWQKSGIKEPFTWSNPQRDVLPHCKPLKSCALTTT